MKKYFFIALFSVLFISFGQNIFAQTKNSLTIDVTDAKKVFTRSIDKHLLLRVVKDSSVQHRDFGWLVEVVRKPYKKTSKNLIYTNETGVTADRSQVYAWHIGDDEFPNEREIKVKGYPYTIKISLIDPQTEGNGPDAKFISGKLRITWTR